jgi:Putative prokaryotic signal transducing protein
MENKDLLDDDLDWDAELDNWTEEDRTENTAPSPVTMLQTFNSEQEAYVAAALLEGEGISGRVVSSITGGITPFAYGNVRLFVAASQAEAAAKVLRKMTGKEVVDNTAQTSSTMILTIVVIGLFVMGLIIRLIQLAFKSL